MAWSFIFVGTAGNVGPAINGAVVSTSNQDEVNQVAGVKGYLVPKLAGIPAATGVVIRCSGVSNAAGVNLSVLAQVVTIT